MQKELTRRAAPGTFLRLGGFCTVAVVSLFSVAASATTTPANIPNELRDLAAAEGARDLLVRTDEALNALTSTYYRSDGEYWNDAQGVYETDCSGYTNHMVEDAVPEAYDELRDARGVTRPRSVDYYNFFKSIPQGDKVGRWRRPSRVSDLRPGDLLVWKYKVAQSSGSTGHMNIVVSVPVRDSRYSDVYKVRVSDSAQSGHSNDNRVSGGSGVGAGELLIKVDSNGQPIEYAWNLYGNFHNDINLALGRPRY